MPSKLSLLLFAAAPTVAVLTVAPPALAADADIHLSSIGYLPARVKRATVVGSAQDFSVVRDDDGSIALAGTAEAPLADTDTGQTVVVADFTSVTDPGTYHLEVAGIGRSVSFAIDPDVYQNAFVTSMLGFYGWRCGTDVAFDYQGVHYGYPACHLQDAHTDALGVAGMRDGTGGWHDAGDYGKYTVNSALAAGVMLAAWEDFGPELASVALQIPETGGALPDYLVEVEWELRWLLKMQYSATDGRVAHKITEASHPGFIMPADDTGTRSFVPFGTGATADFVAVLAKAARVYRQYDPAFADQCLAAARVSYDYLTQNPANAVPDETGFISPQYASSDEDDRVWAAAEMWATTGDAAALSDAETRIAALTAPIVSSDFDWPNLKNLGLFVYLASPQPGRNADVVAQVTQAVADAANTLVATHALGGYGRALGNYYWGANGSQARTCMVLQAANRLSPKAEYLDTCADQLAYLFGRNGYGRSQVTGLGVNPPLHIHHRPSAADGIDPPYPGLLVGGGWVYRAQASASIPDACALPAGLCWVDEQANYEVNEVAINWNAALVYALASFLGGGPPAPSGAGTAGAPGTAGMSGASSGGSDQTSSGSHHGSKSGCGCRAPGSSSLGSWWLGVVPLALAAWRRRSRLRAPGSGRKRARRSSGPRSRPSSVHTDSTRTVGK
jgi:endoglucanase